jgi:hypothetical protein
MNMLSWLLYVADVVSNISGFIIFGAVVLFAFPVILWTAYAIRRSDWYDSPTYYKARNVPVPTQPKHTVKYIFGAVVCSLIAVALPSKTTIYLIAASELGEKVITGPDSQKTLTLLQQRIQRYLESDLANSVKKE